MVKLGIGDQITILGYVMLQDLEAGKTFEVYHIDTAKDFKGERVKQSVYRFAAVKKDGTLGAAKVGHYIKDVDLWIDNGHDNTIRDEAVFSAVFGDADIQKVIANHISEGEDSINGDDEFWDHYNSLDDIGKAKVILCEKAYLMSGSFDSFIEAENPYRAHGGATVEPIFHPRSAVDSFAESKQSPSPKIG